MRATEWKSLGKLICIENKSVFVIDTGGNKEVLVILHGFPTSSFDYYKVLPVLAEKYRVILHDHIGFGFSEKPLNYSYSLIEQADVAISLWQNLGLNTVTLLAHDYGTSIATEIIARYNRKQINFNFKELILCNGSMHIELAKLRIIQKLLKNKWTGKWAAKMTNPYIFNRNIKKTFFNKTKINNEELRDIWFLLTYNNGRKVFHLISNYLNERYFFWHRWIGALTVCQIPVRIVWAVNDPIAIPAIAKQLHSEIPINQLTWIHNSGHFPMLETPKEWCVQILAS
ncbi:alpha/beta fold hydrolase [Tenacibaculum sp. TC6]|uniref:alpha/beta fold hydrolase n=1 Tax=Tenacibaculum sp. TC6 TaxID=3423223 RepID=UPI003D359DC4